MEEININIDPDKLESKYSDSIFISNNPFGFNFDFAQQIPQMNMVKIISRISISPQHAKTFSQILADNIKKYEEQFGHININPNVQKEAEKRQEIGFKIAEEKRDDKQK